MRLEAFLVKFSFLLTDTPGVEERIDTEIVVWAKDVAAAVGVSQRLMEIGVVPIHTHFFELEQKPQILVTEVAAVSTMGTQSLGLYKDGKMYGRAVRLPKDSYTQ